MERVILHSDLNNFYASVECLHHPELRGKPVVVCGSVEARHGIILAKNMQAKAFGIKTGMAIWQAAQLCPRIVCLPPDMGKYIRFSRLTRKIYEDYTDLIEPFGIDECWLDVTGSTSLFGSGEQIAQMIRAQVKQELGITVSIGVSFNKIFAKLGSDLKKPDAVTVITKENYRDVVWPLPADSMIFVGNSTMKKLHSCGINTIGDLATAPTKVLDLKFGKVGGILSCFANGNDLSRVMRTGEKSMVKSVGNSSTMPRDLETLDEVKLMLYVLSESVAMRLREQGLRCDTVEISIRDNELFSCTRRHILESPTCVTTEIADSAFSLFKTSYSWTKPLRSIGVRGCNLSSMSEQRQLSLYCDESLTIKQEQLEGAIDALRGRYGYKSVMRGITFCKDSLTKINPKDDHTVHPVGYFK
ncbi:MAG: DNA polymerase IV [Oscillospiraceae bacterium]